MIPEVRRLLERSGTASALDHGAGVDGVIAAMDRAGIEWLLVRAWCRPPGWAITNDEAAQLVAAHPDRFSGIAAVDPAQPMLALAGLERAVSGMGFKALRVIPWLWELPPDDRLYYLLSAECVELGAPLCTSFPQLPLERCAQEARAPGLPAEVSARFLTGNARRVLAL